MVVREGGNNVAAFAVGSWSFHALFNAGKINLYGYLESVKYRYHLQHADIWSGMLASTEDGYIRGIKEILDENELRVANLAVDGADVWHEDPAVRERNRSKALRYLDIAREWGARTLRIDMGVHSEEISSEQYAFLVERYREYTQFASDHGFVVGPQTHQAAAQCPRNLQRLHVDVASPGGFGVILNVNRWLKDKEIGDELVAPFTAHAQFDRAFVDFAGAELKQKVGLLYRQGYRGCWSLEYRGGTHEYAEVGRDLLDIRLAVKQVLAPSELS